MSTTLEKQALTLLVRDPEAPALVPDAGSLKIILEPQLHIAEHAHNLFVLVAATYLRDVAQFVSVANRRNQLRALFVRPDVDATWLPQMFELAKLRTMRNTLVHSDFRIPFRVLGAWQSGAQAELIANARIAGEEMLVVSCEPEVYRIPFASVAALRQIPVRERGEFQLADDGSYLHWPKQDVHLDLEAMLVAIDPERGIKADRIKSSYGREYGSAIAALRKERGLRQSEIEGLSEREIRRIESGGQATVDSLRKLATSHRVELPRYLAEVAERASELQKHPRSGPSSRPTRSRPRLSTIRHRATKRKRQSRTV